MGSSGLVARGEMTPVPWLGQGPETVLPPSLRSASRRNYSEHELY
jgi:hypothetical protein